MRKKRIEIMEARYIRCSIANDHIGIPLLDAARISVTRVLAHWCILRPAIHLHLFSSSERARGGRGARAGGEEVTDPSVSAAKGNVGLQLDYTCRADKAR